MVVLLETTGTPETLAITVQAETGALLGMMVTPGTLATTAVRAPQVMEAVRVIRVIRVTLVIRAVTATAAVGAQQEPVAAVVMVARQALILRLLPLAEILVAQMETGRDLVTAAQVVWECFSQMGRLMLAEAGLVVVVVAVITVVAVQEATQVRLEVMETAVVTEAEQLEVTPETRVTLELTETPVQQGQEQPQGTQETLVPQEIRAMQARVQRQVMLVVRLRLLGLEKQEALARQEGQAGRLLMPTKL